MAQPITPGITLLQRHYFNWILYFPIYAKKQPPSIRVRGDPLLSFSVSRLDHPRSFWDDFPSTCSDKSCHIGPRRLWLDGQRAKLLPYLDWFFQRCSHHIFRFIERTSTENSPIIEIRKLQISRVISDLLTCPRCKDWNVHLFQSCHKYLLIKYLVEGQIKKLLLCRFLATGSHFETNFF